jgi:NAD(P)-dependent dehydrogenase (short-subunit alcohol dehydrogenase family)
MNIEGVSAVVTGAASGLGEATARELARRGAKVAVFDRDTDKGEKVAADIGGIFCEVDVTSDEKVAAAFEKARQAHGQERVLVNCAG